MACEHCVKQIDTLERLTNDSSGNPRYRVTFTDGTTADTASGSNVNYGITNRNMRGDVTVTYTRAGKISDMRPA